MPRPKVPLIDRKRALRAALEIIETDGLDGLSLDRLAVQLGVRAPSLYHHFTDKSEILTEAARLMLSDVPLEADPPPDDWIEWFVRLSVRTYRLVMSRPRTAELLFLYYPRSLTMPAHEKAARILARAGIKPAARLMMLRGMEKLLFGLVLAEAEDKVHGWELRADALDPDVWPHLRRAIESNTWNDEDMFAESMRAFLSGAASRYTSGSTAASKNDDRASKNDGTPAKTPPRRTR